MVILVFWIKLEFRLRLFKVCVKVIKMSFIVIMLNFFGDKILVIKMEILKLRIWLYIWIIFEEVIECIVFFCKFIFNLIF